MESFIKNNDLLKNFNDDCKVIDLYIEYGENYTGNERYGIISTLSEEDINEKYADIIFNLKPYILLDENFESARNEYIKNDEKIKKRISRSYGISIDSETINLHPELWNSDTADIVCGNISEDIMNAYNLLSQTQKEVINMIIFENRSFRETAEIKGKCLSTIENTYRYAIKKMRKELLSLSFFSLSKNNKLNNR